MNLNATARWLPSPSGGGTYQYTIKNGDKVVLKSKGNRYIAFLIFQNPQDPNSKFYMSHRFGREDLIGNGQSKRVIGLPGYHLVRVQHEEEKSTGTNPGASPA